MSKWFDESAIERGLRFRAVIVDPREGTKKAFQSDEENPVLRLSLYNRSTDKYVPTEVRLYDPETQARAYGQSEHRKLYEGLKKIGISMREVEDIGGWEVEFKTRFTEFNGHTSTHYDPISRISRVVGAEYDALMMGLEARRAASRTEAQAAAVTTQPQFTALDSHLEDLLACYVGHTQEEAVALAEKAGLSADMINDIQSGTVTMALLGRGILDVDEDGVFSAR